MCLQVRRRRCRNGPAAQQLRGRSPLRQPSPAQRTAEAKQQHTAASQRRRVVSGRGCGQGQGSRLCVAGIYQRENAATTPTTRTVAASSVTQQRLTRRWQVHEQQQHPLLLVLFLLLSLQPGQRIVVHCLVIVGAEPVAVLCQFTAHTAADIVCACTIESVCSYAKHKCVLFFP